MTDLTTAEDAQTLLDADNGSRLALDRDQDAFLLPSGLPNNLVALPASDDVDGNYQILHPTLWVQMIERFNAAPDLARTVIALHAQLADAHAERDAARQLFTRACAPLAASADIQDVVAAVEEWVNQRGGEETADQIAVMAIQAYQRATEAERDRLAAANAVLESKVAGLVEAARTFRRMPNSNDAGIALDAALATREAGNG